MEGKEKTAAVQPAPQYSPAELEEIVRLQGEGMAQLKADNDALQAKLKALEANVPKASAPSAPTGTFKIGSREYRVLHALKVRDGEGGLKTYSPADILANKELREHLVAIKSNAVVAVQ